MKLSILSLVGATLLAASLAGTSIAAEQKAKCAVSGAEVVVTEKTAKTTVQGKPVYFCCDKCPTAFAKTPEKFVKDLGECPVQVGTAISAAEASKRVVLNNGLWYLCCEGCVGALKNAPVKVKELEDVVSHKKFKVTADSPRSDYKEQVYLFANAENKTAFDKEPAKYAVVYGK
jgi:YHS domain-containing protein